MKREPLKVIVVEDCEDDAVLVIRRLEQAGLPCDWVRIDTAPVFLERVSRSPCDLVICDYSMPEFDSLGALQLLREKDRITPFILLSGNPDYVLAVEALRIGATDFLSKTQLERLPAVVERALKESRVLAERRQSEQALQSSEQKLRSIFDQALDVILVIQGVTGTILRVNQAALTVLGYEENQLVGKHFSLLFPPRSELTPENLLKRLRVSGPVFESQPFLRADGTICPMDITASLLPWGQTQAILTTLRDVTVRNQVEETLRMTQFAIDHCKHLVLWTRPDGTFSYVNEAACEFLGYRREELLALHVSQIDPAFGPEILPIHWEELKNFGSFSLDSKLRRKDGALVPVEVVFNYFSYQGAEYNCAIARDVTDRKKAEQALLDLNADLERHVEQRTRDLRRSEEKLHALLKYSSDLVSVLDEQGVILYKSDSVETLLGHPAADFVGRPFRERVHPDDLPAIEAALAQVRTQPDKPVRVERRIERREGGWITLESIITNRLADPAIHGLVVNSRDVSERKVVEEALRTTRERLRFLISASPAVLFTRKCGGGHDPTWMSENVRDLAGYPPGKFIATPGFWAEQIEPADLPGVMTHLAAAAQEGSQINEYRFRHQNGAVLWLQEGVVMVRGADGRPLEQVGYLIDVTARRLFEESLRDRDAELSRANAELRRATRLKDEFLASMSHELRTPLNAILTLSEILQEEAYGPVTPKQAKSLETIHRSGRHLLDLIGDILDLSKIESGKLELNLEVLAAAAVAESSLSFVREDALRKRIDLKLCDRSPGLFLRADSRRLNQILINLLSNAVKFTPDGGSVRLEIEGDAPDQAVAFHVVDTGIGIASADLTRLFRPFVQLDSSLSRRFSGTGLGLSLVSRLVRLHQGSILVESTPGQGSRFTVRLSLEGSAAAAPVEAFVPPRSGEEPPREFDRDRPLLLLADDNEITLQTLAEYFAAQNYEVAVARTGREAVEQAGTLRPALILMDIQMPEMDGLEAIRRLVASPRTAGIPIVALTALAMPGDRERCLQAGAAVYLSKPVPLRKLMERIEKTIDRSSVAAGEISP